MAEIENFLWSVRWDFTWKKIFKKKMTANEIFRFFQKHVFPFSWVFRGFPEKLMAEIGLLRVFLHIYSFRIFFQAVFYHFLAFSQKALTLVESHPMSLVGHNSGCLRPRGLKISGVSYLYVIKIWKKFVVDPMTRPVNYCCFGSERLKSFLKFLF